jgi:hypothetical protein
VLAVGDHGHAALALNAHFDDADQDCVVFVWSGARAAIMGPPNDEAQSGHRLYRRGLSDVLWAGIVEQSAWIRDLEQHNRVHSRQAAARFARLTHFILPLKECTVETVAQEVTVLRFRGLPALPQPYYSGDQATLEVPSRSGRTARF